jgi:DNA-binding LacI/PurR family transcriptional regulator
MLLGSDEVAEGALEAFRELGLRVPKDVAVIIYQDIQTLESKWPTGTCIEMFPDYIWENALEILFGRISQKRSRLLSPRTSASAIRHERFSGCKGASSLTIYLPQTRKHRRT